MIDMPHVLYKHSSINIKWMPFTIGSAFRPREATCVLGVGCGGGQHLADEPSWEHHELLPKERWQDL